MFDLILEVEEMILMFTMTFPSTSAAEYGKAVAKNSQEHPFPDFVKPLGLYGVFCEEGFKVYAIIETEKGKEDEAFKVFNLRNANYLSIPGYGYKEERLLTMEESFTMISMATPTV
jgi:hypothetical protein